MKKISILLPTRSRPQRFQQGVVSLLDNAMDRERIELLVYIDEDDPELQGYGEVHRMLLERYQGVVIQFILGFPVGTNRSVNVLVEFSHGDILFHAADDCLMRTPGWDRQLEQRDAAYADGIYLAWFDDGKYHDRMAIHPIVGRRWWELLGCFLPCYFLHLHSDLRLTEIATKIGRTCFIDTVVYEHLHHVDGKAAMDATYQRILHRNPYTLDNELLQRTQRYMELDAAVLRHHLRGSPTQEPESQEGS